MSALADLKRVHEVARKFSGEVGVIINKYDLNEPMADRIEGWCAAQETTILGRLPFEKKVTESMVDGKSIAELCPESEISKTLGVIWNKLISNGKE